MGVAVLVVKLNADHIPVLYLLLIDVSYYCNVTPHWPHNTHNICTFNLLVIQYHHELERSHDGFMRH
jgi:hypothetical protein